MTDGGGEELWRILLAGGTNVSEEVRRFLAGREKGEACLREVRYVEGRPHVPVTWACLHEDGATLGALVEAVASMKTRFGNPGVTPLIALASCGGARAMELAVMGTQDSLGDGALAVACEWGNVEAVMVLLLAGCGWSAKKKTVTSITPFGAARKSAESQPGCLLPLLELLFEAGFWPDGANGDGRHLVKVCSPDEMELVLELCGDIGGIGGSLFREAAARHSRTMAVLALRFFADALDEPDRSGDTPLHVCCRHGSVQVAEMFLCRGADIFAENKAWGTPLVLAIERESEPLQALLRSYGTTLANVNRRRLRRMLCWACRKGKVQVVYAILEEVPDVDREPSTTDVSPLACACASHSLDIVKLLLDQDDVPKYPWSGPGSLVRGLSSRCCCHCGIPPGAANWTLQICPR